MSGGSYNYAFRAVEEMAESLESNRSTPERLAFAALLREVAKAMHDIEWVDSCDMGKGEEVPAILACVSRADVQGAMAKRLREVMDQAQDLLERMG